MTFPIETVREAFPALNVSDQRDQPIVYFDNPAGTQVPSSVALAISDAILFGNGNLGGAFKTSQLAGDIYHQAHLVMADFLGSSCKGEGVTIAQSMTAITYSLSRAISRDWQQGDDIIITTSDHDGNVSPWVQAAEDRGVTVKKLPFRQNSWQYHPEDLVSLVSPRTKLLALNYANNMTGAINELSGVIAMARDTGIQTYVDAVQFAPHRLIDFNALGCDYLVCSSYKFFGPHLGIMVGKPERLEKLQAYKVRPAPDQGMGKFENGTPQIELLAGLIACIEYFADIGRVSTENDDLSRREAIIRAFQASVAHEDALCRELITGLRQINGVQIHGIVEENRLSERVPTVSFTHERLSSRDIATQLAQRGVSCWSGHNYALETAMQLGLNLEDGVVRLGIAHYNTQEEVQRVIGHIAGITEPTEASLK